MAISLSVVLLLAIILVVLIRGGSIKAGPAIVAVLFGFFLASTGMAPSLNRFLNSIRPDKVHILVDGRIVQSGGQELAEQLDRLGYDALLKEVAANGR